MINDAAFPELFWDAWRISTEDPDIYGVLVQCGTERRPYWWLLCPATATLYVGKNPNLTECRDGEQCSWLDDIHRDADALRHNITNQATELVRD